MSTIVETHSASKPRIVFLYLVLGVMLLALGGGLVYRQIVRGTLYSERERRQSQRRVVVPGPRGNIYDRHGNLLVGNKPQFAVTLNIGELGDELRTEIARIRKEHPAAENRLTAARVSLAQRYLDKVNAILGRDEKIDADRLDRQFVQERLLPFVLMDNLAPEEYARLIERLPVDSPLQVYVTSNRYYPNGSLAAHTLGYVKANNDPSIDDFPGENLHQFKMKGTVGETGLEKKFDEQLQGMAGGAIYRVDNGGYRTDLPLQRRLPVQGQNLVTSLDIDLQQAAEKEMANRVGACVALDVNTGEVLVLASKPDYDLNQFVPFLSSETGDQIEKDGAWLHRAIQGRYPPGSTFKIIVSAAALRSGVIDAHNSHTICPGYLKVGNRRFPCDARSGHGDRDLVGAIRDSCNVFFYTHGLELGPELIAAEARRFGYGHPTGIELPYEMKRPVVPDPDWRKKNNLGSWNPGDTANISIGQGDLLVSPIQVACFVASFARGEFETKPTILHDEKRPRQHSESIGLSRDDYATIVEGMEQCAQIGTSRLAKVEGLRMAAKTGTAQLGRIDLAWMIAYAPVDNPRIAIAVVLEGTEPDASFHGGTYAAPVVKAVFQTWFDAQQAAATSSLKLK